MDLSRNTRKTKGALLTSGAFLLPFTLLIPISCSDDVINNIVQEDEVTVPATYAFDSIFESGTSSVSYSGQVARHVILSDLATTIGNLTGNIDDDSFNPAAGDTYALLNSFYEFDGDTDGTNNILLSPAGTDTFLQSTYNDISTGKDLQGKFAGNDSSTDHKDWDDGLSFKGWSSVDGFTTAAVTTITDVDSPEKLLLAFFEEIDHLAAQRENGIIPDDPDGTDISEVFVNEHGLDLKQLAQKFLRMGMEYSQGADDYLDDDVADKGILADNSIMEGTDPYTAMEHNWDEGFGYFGAARNLSDYTDDEIAAKPDAGTNDNFENGYNDADSDGSIDLTSEYNFGGVVNAAKRDRASATTATTDFTDDAFLAFRTGRAIITEAAAAGGDLTDEQRADLNVQRDAAVLAWEKSFAATVVHYINDVIQDMNDIGTVDYDFLDHAKHWGEMKGFALGLQFNPRSQLSDALFEELHELMGDAPVISNNAKTVITQAGTALTLADFDAYIEDLLQARSILQAAYQFDDDNIGDENGENGW